MWSNVFLIWIGHFVFILFTFIHNKIVHKYTFLLYYIHFGKCLFSIFCFVYKNIVCIFFFALSRMEVGLDCWNFVQFAFFNINILLFLLKTLVVEIALFTENKIHIPIYIFWIYSQIACSIYSTKCKKKKILHDFYGNRKHPLIIIVVG